MHKIRYWLIAVIIITIAVYYNALQTDFLFDDTELIVNNHQIKSFENIKSVLAADFFADNQGVAGSAIGYYRPVITLSYMIDYKIWKLNAKGYHLTNLLLHMITVIFIFLFISRIFENNNFAVIVSFLFALHPVQTETVVWISARTDLFATMFFFMSLYTYLLHKQKKKNHFFVWSLFFYVAGLLAKESVIILPMILLLVELLSNTRQLKLTLSNSKKILYFIAITIFYIIYRFVLLKINVAASSNLTESINRLYTFIVKGIPYYLNKLIIPVNLNIYIDYQLAEMRIISVAIFTALLIAAILVLKKYFKKISDEILFSSCFFIIALMPVSNILPLSLAPGSQITIAERYMYLPAASFCVLAAYLLSLVKIKLIRISLIVILLLFYSVAAYNRISDWTDEEKILTKSLDKYPRSLFMLNKLGIINENKGKYEDALAYYYTVISLDENYIGINNNIGSVYLKLHEYGRALEFFKKELQLYGGNPVVFNNTGMVFYNLKRYDDSLVFFNKAIELKNDYIQAYNNAGAASAQLNRFDEAESYFKKALLLAPEFKDTARNLELLEQRKNTKQ